MIDVTIAAILGFVFGTFFGVWIVALLIAGEDDEDHI